MAEPSVIPVDGVVAGRQIPWSEEAEISVLSAMLIDGDAVARAIETVGDGSFYREANRRIFRAMVRLYSRGEVIDVVTLSDELKSAGELDGAGGMAYLARLVDAVPTSANIEYHCRILRDKSVLRQLIDSATDIVRDAYDAPAGEVDDTLDRAEQRIFQIAQASQRQGRWTTRSTGRNNGSSRSHRHRSDRVSCGSRRSCGRRSRELRNCRAARDR